MRPHRFHFESAVLVASLAFILAILGAYAYVGMRSSQGLPWDRRQLAAIAAQLEPFYPQSLRSWVIARGTSATDEGATFPVLPNPPADVKMPPGSRAGIYRASDGALLLVWHRTPDGPSAERALPERFPPFGRPAESEARPERSRPPGRPSDRFLPPGGPPMGIPPREREALVRLCEQAVQQGSATYEFLARPEASALLYAQPLRDGARITGAVWSWRMLRETPVSVLSTWALPATIVAALVGISVALWTAVKLQRNIMAIQSGLELGREMVAGLMPADALEVEGYEIARRVEPATEVGGDFYNLFPISGSCVGVMLGDIAGNGVAAALGMAVVTTLLEEYARSGLAPADVMAKASARLAPRSRARRTFATAIYGKLDLAEHTICLCNAGQTPCIWLRKGEAHYVRMAGTPLGRIGTVPYREQDLQLEPGDTLVFATDGFVEMRNGGDKPLGYDGWLKLVEAHRECSPDEMVARLFDAVKSAANDPSDRDDLTLLVLRRVEPHSGVVMGADERRVGPSSVA